jgi:hypothetical protein
MENVPMVPEQTKIMKDFHTALKVIDDIVLKNYLTTLHNLDIVPLEKEVITSNLSDNIRFFKINEMVYERDEYATYKFASVYNALATNNCAVFVIIDSDGRKTDFYMGIRSLDSERTASSLKNTVKNAMSGQFPGIKTQDYDEDEMRGLLEKIKIKSISVVSSVANGKDIQNRENKSFLQGLEKLALSMQKEKYTGIILANGTPQGQLAELRRQYESIYSQLSAFASTQVNYGVNASVNSSDAITEGTSRTFTFGSGISEGEASTKTHGTSVSDGTSQESGATKAMKGIATAASILGSVLTPFTGGLSLVVGGIAASTANMAGDMVRKTNTHTVTKQTSIADQKTVTKQKNESQADGESYSKTATLGSQSGNSQGLTLTLHDKAIENILERIDIQLKRIQEFESMGMWECAAYFTSDNPYAAEIAASTYKALVRGENSGVEVSAINSWGNANSKKIELLKEYIQNFMHPVFSYPNEAGIIQVTPGSMVSGNELAIHMGLPRHSVCGFPVIEHADFGKETISLIKNNNAHTINLGKIFNMGIECENRVLLNRDNLTSHVFVTGSTGSGKSNTIYEVLDQVRSVNLHFLVIEPAKGEYKHIFGNDRDVSVYGTNPALMPLLRINPFTFNEGIHILEHLDRLVEIFNVCWPMYAAMPAVLKDAIETSYENAGWDLRTSKNKYQQKLYPSFADVVENIKGVINSSEYSDENKGNYKGALITRLKSLTNGINGLIFTADEINNKELFDENVIVDISRVGSMETKALIMGILIMKLHEYRMTSGVMNSDLRHITVLEEAHNLLKRTSTEQSSESANLLGKSVEMLANAIAEMRTYGEGFIIADQSPGLLDMSVIRNTNTKIILRLPDESDRNLVGKAAGLNDDQIIELTRLQCGVAAIYQNEWIQPVLCQVEKFKRKDQRYQFEKGKAEFEDSADLDSLKADIVRYLFSNMINEPLDMDTDRLKERIWKSNLLTGLKLQTAGYISERKPPKNIVPLSGIIAEMYIPNGKAVEMFKKNKSIDANWAKLLESEIRPSIEGFNGKYRQLVMNALVWEISRNENALHELSDKWADFIRK